MVLLWMDMWKDHDVSILTLLYRSFHLPKDQVLCCLTVREQGPVRRQRRPEITG